MPTQPIILVVDDEQDCRDFVTAVLEDAGDYEILTASNGEEAVAIAKARHPALIIMDVHMPKKDGYSAFKEIKTHPPTAPTPVIMLSSLSEFGEQMRFNTDLERPRLFLDKPINPESLKEMILKVLADTGH